MPRVVALLRGVSPQYATSADLKRAFEHAGFAQVRTVLSSGNVAFDLPRGPEDAAATRAERAMQEVLGRSFPVILRSRKALQALIDADPFSMHAVPPDAKRVVSFLPRPVPPRVALPLAQDDACVLAVHGHEALTAYRPHPKGPVFMQLIERAFGKEVTTRTWDTVIRCAKA